MFEDKSALIFYSLMAWGIYELRKFRIELSDLKQFTKKEIKDIKIYLDNYKYSITERLDKLNSFYNIIEKFNGIIK